MKLEGTAADQPVALNGKQKIRETLACAIEWQCCGEQQIAHLLPVLGAGQAECRDCDASHAAFPRSYQTFEALTIFTTDSITGTSIRTPTTVASAAPE